jgi:tetratricopeptide (TPR) repeat protein
MTSDPFDRMLDKAEDNYTNGRYREALAAFHRVRSAKDNPYPPGILDSWIGLCHFYLSEWKEATQCLLNSYESINSADYAVVFLQCVAALGELMWRQGDCRKALGFFREGEDLLQIYETNQEWGQHLFSFRLRK